MAKCPKCGRFARVVFDHHYYDGNWNQITITTDCSQCGRQKAFVV